MEGIEDQPPSKNTRSVTKTPSPSPVPQPSSLPPSSDDSSDDVPTTDDEDGMFHIPVVCPTLQLMLYYKSPQIVPGSWPTNHRSLNLLAPPLLFLPMIPSR